MGTVTLGRSSFEALLKLARYHTSGRELELDLGRSHSITISHAEHDYLLEQVREYNVLKNALFRGGLTTETLETLLAGEGDAGQDGTAQHLHSSEKPSQQNTGPANPNALYDETDKQDSDTVGNIFHSDPQTWTSNQYQGCGHPESDNEHDQHTAHRERVHIQDRRTLLVTNLSDRTTHKDLATIARGGRLLEIYIRHDRSATISFIEGAAEFLAYTKRNDIYLHTKRLEFSWSPRQFHVPNHILYKIASGASRNLIVRGVAGRVTAEEIREQLDHIHNLVVVDISFANEDALISTNSVHNAVFARTCMMSRTVYKGVKIDWALDECAAPLPQSRPKPRNPVASASRKPTPMKNHYALLDTGSDLDSGSEDESYLNDGVRIDHSWANAVVT